MSLSQGSVAVPFNPDASAAILKVKVGNHARLTAEIVSEVYRAREFYYGKGNNQHSIVPVGTTLTSFEKYLDHAGLARRTAYNWLERYVPEENKLLTYEEFSEKKEAERLAKMSAEERERSMIAEFRKTGIKPPGWTPKLDKAVKDSDAAFARQQERIDEYKRQQDRKSEAERPDAPPPEDADYYYRLGKSTEEMLKSASTTLHTKHTERQNWKEKIRLSDGGKEDAFMDAIIDYMETLSDDNRRIEACNNIIKICRNISVELQKKNTVK